MHGRLQNKRTIVACIPAFDEEATIAKVIVKARKHADKIIVVERENTFPESDWPSIDL
jgi:hypothetical protein